MLTQEYGTGERCVIGAVQSERELISLGLAASNIKSRVNRLSVLAAITSTQQRLKLYNKVPPNGLVVYCGTILTDEGKEKKVNIDFEPFKPINTSLYLCDNKFHTEALAELLESDAKFGFIVMDGNGALFGTLAGNTREVLQKFTVDLPKKHGRGGQSALRFARLRTEKRHNYVRKVAEHAVQHFITDDKVNVQGLVLAGSADFKNDLNQSDLFDLRLQAKVIKIVDVSYGGENGFNQAIELASESLSNVKFVQEKKWARFEGACDSWADPGACTGSFRSTLTRSRTTLASTASAWTTLCAVSRWEPSRRSSFGRTSTSLVTFCATLPAPKSSFTLVHHRPTRRPRELRLESRRCQRRSVRNSWTRARDWRWSRRVSHRICSSGCRRNTRTLEQSWNS